MFEYLVSVQQYDYLGNGVRSWILLLPDNIGIEKSTEVQVWEVNSDGIRTGRASTGLVRFINGDGNLTTPIGFNFYFIDNVEILPVLQTYRCLLTQTGTSAPVATVLENTTGLTITWQYKAVGRYGFQFPGAFDYDKIHKLIAPSDVITRSIFMANASTGLDVTIFTMSSPGTLVNAVLNKTSFQMFIYP